jgi:hypothetical protein
VEVVHRPGLGPDQSAQGGRRLEVRVGTVKKHVEHIFDRLGTDTRLGAARLYLDGTPPRSSEPWWLLEGRAREQLASPGLPSELGG